MALEAMRLQITAKRPADFRGDIDGLKRDIRSHFAKATANTSQDITAEEKELLDYVKSLHQQPASQQTPSTNDSPAMSAEIAAQFSDEEQALLALSAERAKALR